MVAQRRQRKLHAAAIQDGSGVAGGLTALLPVLLLNASSAQATSLLILRDCGECSGMPVPAWALYVHERKCTRAQIRARAPCICQAPDGHCRPCVRALKCCCHAPCTLRKGPANSLLKNQGSKRVV